MPQITKINAPQRNPKKRSVHLDGKWAFNLPAPIVERFALVVGMELSDAEIEKVRASEVQQKAFDKGLAILSTRLHARSELKAKLTRAKYTAEQVEAALAQLERLGYIDDERFAKAKATSAAEHRKHGRRRAYVELIKAGVDKETARKGTEDVYDVRDSMKVARELAAKKAPSLRRLDPATARRRLMGMLLRRGFTFDEIKPVMDEALGAGQAGPENAPPPAAAPAAVEPEPVAGTPEEHAAEPAEEEATADEPAGNWRSAMLPAHMRKKEKARPGWSSFGRKKRK